MTRIEELEKEIKLLKEVIELRKQLEAPKTLAGIPNWITSTRVGPIFNTGGFVPASPISISETIFGGSSLDELGYPKYKVPEEILNK